MNPKAHEAEKKIAAVLFHDKTDNASSKDLHSLAALTFNPQQADLMFRVLKSALDPQQNSWQTLLKAVMLVEHFVRFGAERCVDFAWDASREVDALVQYNSALVKGSFGSKVGARTWRARAPARPCLVRPHGPLGPFPLLSPPRPPAPLRHPPDAAGRARQWRTCAAEGRPAQQVPRRRGRDPDGA